MIADTSGFNDVKKIHDSEGWDFELWKTKNIRGQTLEYNIRQHDTPDDFMQTILPVAITVETQGEREEFIAVHGPSLSLLSDEEFDARTTIMFKEKTVSFEAHVELWKALLRMRGHEG